MLVHAKLSAMFWVIAKALRIANRKLFIRYICTFIYPVFKF